MPSLPYPDGSILAQASLSHLTLVLVHFPKRGPSWASSGQYVTWLHSPTTNTYTAGIYEIDLNRAIDMFSRRLKNELKGKLAP
mgnify:CR=1 FL=1|tara:strand:- start:68 stop:316 length:249 start_codon:yes stop_codon:yes gene_type:complete